MDRLNIGFIGGCISNQPGMAREALYHSVLSKSLSENGAFVNFQISLATYFSFGELHSKMQRFIDKKQPDVIFLFIRPFPLMPLQKLLIKYDKSDKQTGWAFHPALIFRRLEWRHDLTEFQTDNGYQFVRRNKFEFRDVNLLAGISLGLHRWAIRYLRNQIEMTQALCDKENIKLTIISPPKNPESIVGDWVCQSVTRFLEAYCNENQIRIININTIPKEKFEKDNLHFNADGHSAVAKMIYDELSFK